MTERGRVRGAVRAFAIRDLRVALSYFAVLLPLLWALVWRPGRGEGVLPNASCGWSPPSSRRGSRWRCCRHS